MIQLNDLIMAIFMGLLLWLVNSYIPIAPLINLLLNVLLLILMIIYIMQSLRVVRGVLPTPRVFK